MELQNWFDHLWADYSAIAPRVSSIRQLLLDRGESVQNDHVAFRTLNIAPIDLNSLERVFFEFGYEAFDDYAFEAKKLRARSYSHPDGWPRLFLSELLVDELEPHQTDLLRSIVAQLPADLEIGPQTFWAGRLWDPISHAAYVELQNASEYAAWFAAHGLRPNHFTVNVNALDTVDGLDDLLDIVVGAGFSLNEAGGRIKGTPEVMLEQGSTLADRLPVVFAGGESHEIPTCYYEFALRHATPDGALYDGFVTTSADRIFESTNARR